MIFLQNTRSCQIFFAFLIIAIIAFQGIASTEAYHLEKVTRPADLQSLIKPKEDSDKLTWLGADAATSVEITPDRYVWLFGDTILGKSKDGIRKYSVFIHNSIGVAKRSETGNFTEIEKVYRKEGEKIRAVFSSQKNKIFYWPLVGTALDSSLLISGRKVSTKDTKSFKILGTTFFTVKNPMEPPEDWKYDKQFLPKQNGIVWGNALLKKGDWIYVFGQKGTGFSSKNVLGRIHPQDVESGSWDRRLHFLDGEWNSSSTPTPIDGLPGTSEMTIQHNSFFGWYCLQIPPLSFDIHLYTAEKVTGPWHDQGAVYKIPSPWSTEKTEKGKHVFSAYAVKSHPELSKKESEIVLTYNLNLNPFVPGLSNKLQRYIGKKKYKELYVPQFVSLDFRKERSD